MAVPKINCIKCGAEILVSTAERTNGLCLPCKEGRAARPDPNLPLKVCCRVHSDTGTDVVFVTTAQLLLEHLETTRHMGDSQHPNRLELEAQRSLLRHALRYRAEFFLHDDHWGRTSFVLIELFESGQAKMEIDDLNFTFAEITKEDWSDVVGPLCGQGGFLYRDSGGQILYKRQTWVS